MARLPDETAFGAVDARASGRPIATYDTSGYARGAAAMGEGAKDLGGGIMTAGKALGAFAAQKAAAEEKLQQARTNAELTAKELARTNAIERESDPVGLVARHADEAAKEFEQAALRIADPQRRADLLLHRDGYVAGVTRAAKQQESVLSASSEMTRDWEAVNALRNDALDSQDPSAFNRTADVFGGLVDAWHGAGLIDAAKAVDIKRNWATGLAEQALLQASPTERVQAIAAATRPVAVDAANAPADGAEAAADPAALQTRGELAQLARMLPADVQTRIQHEAQVELERGAAQQTWRKAEQYEQSMAQAERGEPQPPPWRAAIQADPDLDDLTRMRLLKQHDAMQRKLDTFWQAKAEYDRPNGRKFNVDSPEDREFVDQIYTRLGADTAALHAVVNRTGMLPDLVSATMLGDLASDDPSRVLRSVEQLGRLSATYPNLLISSEESKELQYAATQFQYEMKRGATPNEAVQRIIHLRSAEYQQAWAEQRKAIDIDAEVAKSISPRDLDGLPHAEPVFAAAAFQIYSELVRDRFEKTGDIALAKEQAKDQLAGLLGELDPESLITKSDLDKKEPPSWLKQLSETWPGRLVQSAYEHFKTASKYIAGEDVSYDEIIASTAEIAQLLTGTSFVRPQLAKSGEVILGVGATRRALAELKPIVNQKASLGSSETKQYRLRFLDAFDIKVPVVVHHAIEQRVLRKYAGVITESEMHSLQNLRGIPLSLNNFLHLGQIRREWNRFYATHPTATKKQLLDKATEIDMKYGSKFIPPRIFQKKMLYT